MQLIVGGIIGMSFINSVFVDAMVSDNNEGIEEKLEELDKKLTALTQELERMRKQE
jgi:voltage-gated sodium channel